jgi:hypothetical protein
MRSASPTPRPPPASDFTSTSNFTSVMCSGQSVRGKNQSVGDGLNKGNQDEVPHRASVPLCTANAGAVSHSSQSAEFD